MVKTKEQIAKANCSIATC